MFRLYTLILALLTLAAAQRITTTRQNGVVVIASTTWDDDGDEVLTTISTVTTKIVGYQSPTSTPPPSVTATWASGTILDDSAYASTVAAQMSADWASYTAAGGNPNGVPNPSGASNGGQTRAGTGWGPLVAAGGVVLGAALI